MVVFFVKFVLNAVGLKLFVCRRIYEKVLVRVAPCDWFAWKAALDGREYPDDTLELGICPAGWHIPSITEWNDLLKETEAPGDLMAVNGFWERAGATNRLGFSAIGTRYDEASVFNETWFWTKEETKFGYSWISNVFQEDVTEYAAYIRCIED